MSPPSDFTLYVEDDLIRVKFVNGRSLGRLNKKHRIGGDYKERVIRLPRGDYLRSQRAAFLHELGHYFYDRHDLKGDVITEEDYCDALAWLPPVLTDPRNEDLRRFLLG